MLAMSFAFLAFHLGGCVHACPMSCSAGGDDGDEMMSRPLRAYFISFSFRPTPSRRLVSICLLRLVPRPPGRGMCGLAIDLRLRAWRRYACSFPCRRSLRLPARSLFPAQSSSGLSVGVSSLSFPSHRMSNELVKTAPAGRSSFKPFQFAPVAAAA